MSVDPWTQVLLRLWAILEADATFASLVKPGNRIQFTDPKNPNPIKEGSNDSDCPEVTIVPGDSQEKLGFTSGSILSHQPWTVKVRTSHMCLGDESDGPIGNLLVFPLKLAIIRSILAAGDSLGLGFVSNAKITTCVLNSYDIVESRGTKGWVLFVTVNTDIELPRHGAKLT